MAGCTPAYGVCMTSGRLSARQFGWLALSMIATTARAAEQQTGAIENTFAASAFVLAGALILGLILRPTCMSAWRIASREIARRRLTGILAGAGTEVLSDVILPSACEGLTRIDHIVLTAGGAVCVQANHQSGFITGADDDPQWSWLDGTRRRSFLNPVIQNEGHVKAIRKAVPGLPVASVVVFCSGARFASQQPAHVVSVGGLATWLDNLQFDDVGIEDWETVWLRLKAAALTDEESRRDFDAQLSFG
ncbi:MAG: nuclease-related domain-containing protein [Pseudomonadota bacterium]